MRKLLVTVTAALLMTATALTGCSDKGAATKTKISVKPKTGDQSEDKGGGSSTADKDSGTVAAGFGSFKGRVTLEGTAPQLELLVSKGANIKDADVCAAEDVPNEKLVVGSNGGVANVFVYLQNAPAGAKKVPPPTEPILFDQKNCRFIPHALVVQVGRPLQVVSSDGVLHNTHIKPVRGPRFNESIQPNSRTGVTTKYTTFENQPIPVNCDIHGWMIAWQLPLDHQFAAVTNENGEFEIKELPAGTHKFKVWHEGAEFIERSLSVDIKPDAPTEQNIAYPVAKFKP